MRILFLALFVLALLVTEIETRGDVAISKFNPKLSLRKLMKRERRRTKAKARRMKKRAARKRRRERIRAVFTRGDFVRS